MKIAVITASLLISTIAAHAADTSVLDRSAQALAAGRWNQSTFLGQKALAAGLSAAETVKALNNLCISQAKLSRFSEALTTCDKAVAAGPAEWPGYINRGNLRVMTGDIPGARADYARAKALNPAHPVVQAAAEFKVTPVMTTVAFVGLARDGMIMAQTAGVGKTAADE